MEELTILSHALDELSWQRLEDIYPILAEAIRQEVDQGHTPDEVRRFVMRHSGHVNLANWCAAAARAHIARSDPEAEQPIVPAPRPRRKVAAR